MNQGDLHKVWEIKALKRKPRDDEARKVLERIANQVQPIMRKRHWRVKLLSEFCPKNGRLLGLNVNRGVHVKLRLRRPNRDDDFYPYDQVLDTMLHELCHNVHGPHDAKFYRLWDELRKECEELISRGVSGTGQGFDLPGRQVGGFSRQPPISQLRKTAAAAAEKRAVLGSLLPSGPRRLGGDSTIMVALTPVQAAAMAAERRLQDDIWCGSGSFEDTEDRESNSDALQDIANVIESERNLQNGIPSRQVSDSVSQKRSRDLDDRSTLQSLKKSKHPTFMDLTGDASTSQSTLSCHSKRHQERRPESEGGLDSKFKYDGTFTSTDVSSSLPSSSKHTQNATDNAEELLMWECGICTLLNPPLAPVCKVCGEQRSIEKDAKLKYWSCKFCTLDNSVNLDRCSACQQWRYSNGPPVSSYAPHRGD